MNRGFKYYYREGLKDTIKSLKNRENYLKYLIFLIGRLIALSFIFPYFMLKLSNVKLHKGIKVNGRVGIIDSFKETNNPKCFWNIVLATIIKLLMIISGAILIGILGLILSLTGYLIGEFSFNQELFAILFSIPAILALIIYIVVYPLYYSPVDYLAQTDKTIGASDIVSLSFNSMKLTGKITVLLTNIITYLILLIYVSLIVGLFVIYMNISSDIAKMLLILGMFILILGLFIIIPLFVMAKNLALVSLYEDMVLDKINLNKSVEGIKIRKFDVKSNNIENELVKMFDETEDEESTIDVLKADFTVKKKKTFNKFKKKNEEKITDEMVKAELTKVVDDVIVDNPDDLKNEASSKENKVDNEKTIDYNIDESEEKLEEIYEDEIITENAKNEEEVIDSNDEALKQNYENIVDENVVIEEAVENIADEEVIIEEVVENESEKTADEMVEDIKEDEKSDEDIEYPKFE